MTEWIDTINAHPVMEEFKSTPKQSIQNLLAVNHGELFICQNTIRMFNLRDWKKKNDKYKILDLDYSFEPTGTALNDQGRLLAIHGRNDILIAVLPMVKTGKNVKCEYHRLNV